MERNNKACEMHSQENIEKMWLFEVYLLSCWCNDGFLCALQTPMEGMPKWFSEETIYWSPFNSWSAKREAAWIHSLLFDPNTIRKSSKKTKLDLLYWGVLCSLNTIWYTAYV